MSVNDHPPAGLGSTGHNRVGRALVYFAAVAVLGSTLYPTAGRTSLGPFECLLCGERGLADALLNVVLFVPLGAGVALRGASFVSGILLAGGLSAGVELAQIFIPGRDASFGDLLFNVVGACLGFIIIRGAPRWTDPPPTSARALALGAAVAVTMLHVLVGLLLKPSLPDSAKYFGMWTPRLRHLQPFRGRVSEATLGALPIVSYDTVNVARVQDGFARGDPIRIRVVADARATALAPIVAIFDDEKREIMLVGAHRDALVFRFRANATVARLDQPDLRASGALRLEHPGDTLRLTLRRERRRVCFDTGAGEQCTMGFTLGRGWGLLLYMEKWPDWIRATLDLLWVAALAFPAGFWARSPRVLIAVATVSVGTLLAVPPLVGLYPTPVAQLLAALVGVLLGHAARSLRRVAHTVSRK